MYYTYYSKIMDDYICIVHQCNSGNLSWVETAAHYMLEAMYKASNIQCAAVSSYIV